MMNKTTALLIAVLAIACGEGAYKKADDAQDAGRQFIRASLDGDFDKAKFYLLKDDDNLYMFQTWQRNYEKMPLENKRLYREANIRPVSIEPVNDSLTEYKYKYWHTSNPKDTVTLSVKKIKGEWLVDMKSYLER
jgi:hypothetical protein